MGYQSEAELELQFIDQLNKQGYSTVSIPDYDTLVENFKVQFEAFNADKLDKPLTDKEWERILNLMLGLLTPPIGMVLYVLSSVSKVPFEKIVRAVLPYLGVLLIVLLMITFIPGLVTFLPNLVL